MSLTLPGTGTAMNTEVISGGSYSGQHNQGVFLAQADGTRLETLNLYGGATASMTARTYAANSVVGGVNSVDAVFPAAYSYRFLRDLRVIDPTNLFTDMTVLFVVSATGTTLTNGTVVAADPGDTILPFTLAKVGSVPGANIWALPTSTSYPLLTSFGTGINVAIVTPSGLTGVAATLTVVVTTTRST